mmetsp:Transcript_3059/g.7226  ORF Transcript_3059/g.7226 Transcript_3059/m.7226 type:complete len:569 (-) Transcript_3059:122-1828(-)
MPDRQPWGIAMVASMLNALQVGTFFMAPTTLMPLIVEEFNAELALAPVPIAIGKISYVICLLPGGMFVDHYGPHRSLLLGFLVLATVASLYALLLSDFVQTIFLHVAMAVAAAICGVPVYAVLIAQWFQSELGVAMGLVLAGFSLSGVITPLALAALASHWNWRVAMGILAALLWVVAVPVAKWVVREPEQPVAESPAEVAAEEDEVKGDESPNAFGLFDLNDEEPFLSWQHDLEETVALSESNSMSTLAVALDSSPSAQPWKTLAFWILLWCYVCLQYCFGSLAENMLLLFTVDQQMPLVHATTVFATLNFAAMSAKLLGGHLGDMFDRFRISIFASSLIFGGMTMFFAGPSGNPHTNSTITDSMLFFYLFAVFFGLGYGATFNALYTFPPVLFGSEKLGRIQSMLFGAGLCGNACGAVVTGILRSNTGSYDLAFLILLCFAASTVLALVALERTPLARSVRSKNAEAGQEEDKADAMEPVLSPEIAIMPSSMSASQLLPPRPPGFALRRSSTFADTLDAGLFGASLHGLQRVDERALQTSFSSYSLKSLSSPYGSFRETHWREGRR